MPIELFTQRITDYRRKKRSCKYCICNKNYGLIDKIAECVALQKRCWDPEIESKKCELYSPRYFEESEYVWI